MRKIPTVFERDWNGDRSRVLPTVTPGCEWVLEGEGIATQKIDGTCCLVEGGKLFKRHEVKPGKPAPDGIFVERDNETGKTIFWVEVGDGPEDRWHREAFAMTPWLPDATYELVGPKIQGNPEGHGTHVLVIHGALELPNAPRDFDGLRDYLANGRIEGIVWHHPDGRKAKIKSRDFGSKRVPAAAGRVADPC